MAQDWDIKPRSDTCSACGKSFGDKERYTAALIFSEDGYVRGDYCDVCREAKRYGESVPFSLWQGVFKMPPPKQEDPLKKETVESLLRRYIEEEDESRKNIIYILAVMLERKRILVEKDVKITDEKVTRIYEHRKTGETFLILDPRLKLDELESVEEEVAMLLLGPRKKDEPGGQEVSAGVEEAEECEDAADEESD